jgi:DNA primase
MGLRRGKQTPVPAVQRARVGHGEKVESQMTKKEMLRVLRSVDIYELISAHSKCEPVNRNYKSTCPYCKEVRIKSLLIYPHKQTFACAVCGKSGDALDFAMQVTGKNASDALVWIARRGGTKT